MAAKSKKRLSKTENKLLKLDKLGLKDVVCSICQSILVEPVTLPCFHDFCHHCFNGSIENNALCCPLCRLRIGSWLRTAAKQKNLVNVELWKFIQTKFPNEINKKTIGEDIDLPEDKPFLRLSAPGEIRKEYEAELGRLRNERLQLEQKHIEKTEFLIKKIQEEEEEAHKKYLEALKKDEMIAQQMQNHMLTQYDPPPNLPRRSERGLHSSKTRLKSTKIDGYLAKNKPTVLPPTDRDSPLITDDNTSTNSSTSKAPISRTTNGGSPEMVPTYGKLIKSLLEKKNKLVPGLWDKENGDRLKDKKEDFKTSPMKTVDTEDNKSKIKQKNGLPSLVVSLPLPYSSILQQKHYVLDNRKEADSVDSMRQELCYFKPIDEVTATSLSNTNRGLPLRVPAVRVNKEPPSPTYEPAPSRDQYFDSLCRLRHLSLTKNLPSTFVLALEILRPKKGHIKCESRVNSKVKKRKSTSPCAVQIETRKSHRSKHIQNETFTKINSTTNNLRRTRSMGSISNENETTPKKAKIAKQRKAVSDRKPYLRSDSKRSSKKDMDSPPLYSETINNNKVSLAVKNLSSPLKNCDVKHIILHEQMRIEKIIEQEQQDLELARRIEAEWNERRPRRAAVKRQVTLNYALRPAKKLKV